MDIVGYKAIGHDGSVCCVTNGTLVYSIEAEKDSNPRHALCSPELFNTLITKRGTEPSIVCGDSECPDGDRLNYRGITPDRVIERQMQFRGRPLRYLSVPHEMCHVACAFALSDLPEGQDFYALVWEGEIGSFYYVDNNFMIERLGTPADIISHVGIRYSFPYHAAGRSRDIFGHSAAGKIMALAGLASPAFSDSPELRELMKTLLDSPLSHEGPFQVTLSGNPQLLYTTLQSLRDLEVDAPEFVRICRAIQDGLFSRFYDFACKHVRRRLPLVIAGGCGLNCDWNTRWRDSGLFDSVFVPPVPNDSGIAIGAAAVGQRLLLRRSKIAWNVYAGEDFLLDADEGQLCRHGFRCAPLDLDCVSEWLFDREWIVAWVQGRCEMGPRALCNRSLLAAPFKRSKCDALNRVKQREAFRPVAPVCRIEDVAEYFEWNGPSPFMSYFQRVKVDNLSAVTHSDGTARLQTVAASQNPITHELLSRFKRKSGVGVLCNTSLNFPGCGFINRASHLIRFVNQTGIPAMVIGANMYVRAQFATTADRRLNT